MGAGVLAEHRPTLPELIGGKARWVIAGLAAVVLIPFALSFVGGAVTEVEVVQREPIEFNFRHSEAFKSVPPAGDELVRIEQQRSGRLVQGFAVAPLQLPSYEGEVGGVLPVLAEGVIDELAGSVDQFELIEEGKARINDAAGYGIVYRGRFEGERRLYGRVVLLPEVVAERERRRRGVRLSITATPSAGVGKATDVGARGLTKKPFRSFRFGLEGP